MILVLREISLEWMSLDLTDGKSTLVQVITWCHQATSHYLIQCWPRSMSPYGIFRPQWVKFPVHVLTCSHAPCGRPGHILCSSREHPEDHMCDTQRYPGKKARNIQLTYWPLERCTSNFKSVIFKIKAWALTVALLSGEYHRTSLMRSQQWFRWWLGAAGTIINPDLYCHLASLVNINFCMT